MRSKQIISNGHMGFAPTVVASFVASDEQNGRSTWIKRVENAKWISARLRAQFAHLRESGSLYL